MNFTKEELIEDIDFLASRIHIMGKFTMDEPRSWGASSNSLCEIAYGIRRVEDVELPSDKSDLDACTNLLVLLPLHRKTVNLNVYTAYNKQKESQKHL